MKKIIYLIILLVFISGCCNYEHRWGCDKSCNTDEDCRCTCDCGCININEKCTSGKMACIAGPSEPKCDKGACRAKLPKEMVQEAFNKTSEVSVGVKLREEDISNVDDVLAILTEKGFKLKEKFPNGLGFYGNITREGFDIYVYNSSVRIYPIAYTINT